MYIYINMISKKTRVERLRRHKDLKAKYEVKLDSATTDAEKKHLRARIEEVTRDIEATKLPEVKIPEPKAILPAITKTAEGTAKNAEEHIVHPLEPKRLELKRPLKKVKNVGNPF